MASCMNCIHDKACDEWAVISGIPFVNTDLCENFKNKADFVEVRHGEWRKPLGDDGSGWNCGGVVKQILGCSCCGHFYQNAPYNYCPNCGAKMYGKGVTDNA